MPGQALAKAKGTRFAKRAEGAPGENFYRVRSNETPSEHLATREQAPRNAGLWNERHEENREADTDAAMVLPLRLVSAGHTSGGGGSFRACANRPGVIPAWGGRLRARPRTFAVTPLEMRAEESPQGKRKVPLST